MVLVVESWTTLLVQHSTTRRRYLVSNDTMLVVSKFNKCETC